MVIPFSIELFIEDENSCRGPLRMEVDGDRTVLELRRRVEDEFGIGSRIQVRTEINATYESYFKSELNHIPNIARGGSTARDF